MTKRLTRKAVAKALVAEGFPADIELVQGNGYLYFAGGRLLLLVFQQRLRVLAEPPDP
jgi:hypothetical protein